MKLHGEEVIDASRKAGNARFCNHSCEPNCEVQKWSVGGEHCMGIFARGAIAADTELNFDYQFERFGGERQVKAG